MPPGPRRQISDIGKLLDPPPKKKPKPSPKQRGLGLAAAAKRNPAKVARGKKMIEDRRLDRRPKPDHFPWRMSDAGKAIIRKSTRRQKKGGV